MVIFVCCAIACILFIVFRRVMFGGELGGSPAVRTGSFAFLVFLWLLYIILCILQAYEIGGLHEATFGIDTKLNHRCNKGAADQSIYAPN